MLDAQVFTSLACELRANLVDSFLSHLVRKHVARGHVLWEIGPTLRMTLLLFKVKDTSSSDNKIRKTRSDSCDLIFTRHV